MKKLFSILLSIFLIATILPITVLAQTNYPGYCDFPFHNDLKRLGPNCSGLGSCCTNDVPNCGFCQILDSVYTFTDWTSACILFLTIFILTIWILFGLFKNKTETKNIFSKKKIIFAAIGICLFAVIRWAIPLIIKFII